MSRYKVFFRETVIKRCHVIIDDAGDVKSAIALARLEYGHRVPEECQQCETEVGDIEVFAVDEFAPQLNTTAMRSWELDGISGFVNEPIDIVR